MRSEGKTGTIFRFGPFCLDCLRGILRGPGDTHIPLRSKSFALLHHLVEHAGLLQSRDELLTALWPNVMVTDDSLTQCVSELRCAFGTHANEIMRTVPRRGYVLIADVRRDAQATATRNTVPRLAAKGRRDSVVVQRFTSPTDQPESVELAAVLTGELTAELTRFEELRVVGSAEQAGDGFCVRGEVRAVGIQLRVTLRLEDPEANTVLWSERCDCLRDDGPAVCDTFVVRLAIGINREIGRESLNRARQKPSSELTPRQLCLIGRDHHYRATEADTLIAREMFDRAIAADPDYAMPYAWQAFTVHRAVTHYWGRPSGQEARDLALQLARRAVEIAPDSPLCLSRFAFSLLVQQRWEEAIDAARAALHTARSVCHGRDRDTCGEVLAHGGFAEEAVGVVKTGLAMDPHPPALTRTVLGRALVLAGRNEEAIAPLRWSAARLPDYAPTHNSLVVAYTETGRSAEAWNALQEVRRLRPHWTPRSDPAHWFFRRHEDSSRFATAFEKAGWTQ